MPSATLDSFHSGTAGNESKASDHEALRSDSIPRHPLRVKPLGNQYLTDVPNARCSIGLWAVLPDEVLMIVLEQFGQRELLRLGSTCRFLYAFCHSEELWKALFLSYASQADDLFTSIWNFVIDSNIVLSQYASRIPKANRIRRLENLTYDEYAQGWTEKPFILTKCIQEWPVCSRWSIDSLLKEYGGVEFRAESVDWEFATYYDYMNNNQDESPLYLFDRKFAEKMGLVVGHEAGAAYWRPTCFGPDLFEVLGLERPAHRWLIIGPERSGSTFHKDPNGTSAWNAVIQGAKYWIMFPPETQVPGVYVSSDSSEVTSPLSIAEWLLTFHEEARQTAGCVEGVCAAGEMLHVPSGWWHLVVNLEQGIALTQNFVPQSPSLKLLSEVLLFLRDKSDQVSGFSRDVSDPFALFTDRLRRDHPEALERALELVDRKGGKKRKWDAAVAAEDTGNSRDGSGGFSFGFGGEDDEIP